MIIVKIFVFILLLAFMLGVLSGVGLLGLAGLAKKNLNDLMRDFQGSNPNRANRAADDDTIIDVTEVELEQCPNCGTFVEHGQNRCEACGHNW